MFGTPCLRHPPLSCTRFSMQKLCSTFTRQYSTRQHLSPSLPTTTDTSIYFEFMHTHKRLSFSSLTFRCQGFRRSCPRRQRHRGVRRKYTRQQPRGRVVAPSPAAALVARRRRNRRRGGRRQRRRHLRCGANGRGAGAERLFQQRRRCPAPPGAGDAGRVQLPPAVPAVQPGPRGAQAAAAGLRGACLATAGTRWWWW